MRIERSAQTEAARRLHRGWVLNVGNYVLWGPDRNAVVCAADRLRRTLAGRSAPEGLAALRRSYDPVMD